MLNKVQLFSFLLLISGLFLFLFSFISFVYVSGYVNALYDSSYNKGICRVENIKASFEIKDDCYYIMGFLENGEGHLVSKCNNKLIDKTYIKEKDIFKWGFVFRRFGENGTFYVVPVGVVVNNKVFKIY